MATYEDMTQLTGWFKETYAPTYKDLVPTEDKILREVDFLPMEQRPGNKWHVPVILSGSHGVTFAAARAGAFSLQEAVAMEMQDAQVEGANIVYREKIPYESINRAKNSKAAFGEVMTPIVKTMTKSISRDAEISHLYGQSATGIGTVASSTNQSATATRLTITTGQWASGLWRGTRSMKVVAYNGTTRVGTDTEFFTVTQIDPASRYVYVSGSAGNITTLDTAAGTPGAVILYRFNGVTGTGGGLSYNEGAGIDKIMLNTGTLFNISATTYSDTWKGNTYSAGSAALTFGKVLAGANVLVTAGLSEDVMLLCNPATWGNLLADQSSARRLDGSYSTEKTKNGARVIEFFSQNGLIEIHSHNFVKEGEAFLFSKKNARRVGSTDITFEDPAGGGQIFFHLQDVAGKEMRCLTEQAIMFEAPAQTLKFTSITNTTP